VNLGLDILSLDDIELFRARRQGAELLCLGIEEPRAAFIRAVLPELSFRSGSAPASSRRCTIWALPAQAGVSGSSLQFVASASAILAVRKNKCRAAAVATNAVIEVSGRLFAS